MVNLIHEEGRSGNIKICEMVVVFDNKVTSVLEVIFYFLSFLSFLSFFPSSLCFYVFIFDTKSYCVVQVDMIFPYHNLHDPGIKNMCYHICHKDIFMGFVGLETQSEWAQGKQKKKVNKKEVAMEFCYKWPQRNDTICRGQWMERNTHIYILRWLVPYRWKLDDVIENRISLRNL